MVGSGAHGGEGPGDAVVSRGARCGIEVNAREKGRIGGQRGGGPWLFVFFSKSVLRLLAGWMRSVRGLGRRPPFRPKGSGESVTLAT